MFIIDNTSIKTVTMEEKIEYILDNNMMHDGQLNKTKAITELLNLFLTVLKHEQN